MKKIFTLLIILVTTLIYAQEREKNQFLIKFKTSKKLEIDFKKHSIKLENKNLPIQVNKITPIGNFKKTLTILLEYNSLHSEEESLNLLKKISEIEIIEYNYIAKGAGVKLDEAYMSPNDSYYSNQWALKNNGTYQVSGMVTTIGADAKVEAAWDISTGDPNMIIAVSDSGFYLDHPDFSDRTWTNLLEIPNNGIDDDENGYIDDIYGWNFVGNNNNVSDDHGHGTNCASIIGAKSNNNIGIAGVNWNSKIMNLKSLNANNSGTYAAMANTLYYAVDNGAKIVSMSIGGTGNSSVISNAISYLNTNNVLLITCMMNYNNNTTYYPAGFSTQFNNVISVGSSDANDKRTSPFFWSTTSGSNYGQHINVIAPGNYIWGLGNTANSLYSYWGGTSQATPIVAGIASLILDLAPNLTPSQVRDIIQNTADDLVGLTTEDVAGFDQYHGHGRVNAYNALRNVQNLSNEQYKIPQNQIRLLNPSRSNLINLSNSTDYSGFTSATIYTLNGKKVNDFTFNLEANSNSITIENLDTGIYILNLKIKDYNKSFKLIIK